MTLISNPILIILILVDCLSDKKYDLINLLHRILSNYILADIPLPIYLSNYRFRIAIFDFLATAASAIKI